MSITAFGIIWIPLCGIFLAQPSRLLQLAVLGSIFEGAAVVTIGEGPTGTPITPALVPALLAVAVLLLQLLLGQRWLGSGTVQRAVGPLILVWLYAVLTGYFIPQILAGSVNVWPQRVDLFALRAIPLEPSRGNVTQGFI